MTLTPQEQDIVRRVLAGESQAAAGRVHDVSQRDVSRIMEAAGYERQCRWVKEGEQAECACKARHELTAGAVLIPGRVMTIANGPLIGNQVYVQAVAPDGSIGVVHPTAGPIWFSPDGLAPPSVTRTPEAA